MNKYLLASAMLAVTLPAYADDLQCWDENRHGTIYRHCPPSTAGEHQPAQRPQASVPQASPPAQEPPPPQSLDPQEAAVPQYSGPPPCSYNHGPYPCAYIPPPGYYPPVYAPGYPPGYIPGPSDPAAYGYGYAGPLGVPGPLAVFRFGPFRFVIP
jgi:hypothetical protein